MRTTRISMAGKVAISAALFALLVVSGQSFANTTNSVPASFSFETFGDGTDLAGTNGWYGEAGVITVLATNSPYADEGNQTPLPDPHDRIAALTGPVTNLFDGGVTATSNVWMDLLIQPRRWQQDEPPADIPEDAQAVLYVDTNGHINARCSFYLPGEAVPTNVWATFDQLELDTNEWIRLTMAFQYQATMFGESFYQIQVNNSEVLTNAYGQMVPGDTESSGGSWFLTIKPDATEFNSVSFTGNSQIDDLVITNAQPDITPQVKIQVVAGTGAIIAPKGPIVAFSNGGSKTFTITTDTSLGYELTNLWWGAGLGEVYATNAITITNTLAMGYSFNNVTSDYTIKAEAYQPGWQGTTADNGTPIQWLVDNNLTDYPTAAEAENGDDDVDGKMNWEEYVTGTDPNSDTSYFAILAQGHGSPSNFVSYYITTNSGVMTPVDIYRSVDLLDAEGWDLVGDDVPRDFNGGNGTSIWWDVDAPSNTPAFYKPVVEWNP